MEAFGTRNIGPGRMMLTGMPRRGDRHARAPRLSPGRCERTARARCPVSTAGQEVQTSRGPPGERPCGRRAPGGRAARARARLLESRTGRDAREAIVFVHGNPGVPPATGQRACSRRGAELGSGWSAGGTCPAFGGALAPAGLSASMCPLIAGLSSRTRWAQLQVEAGCTSCCTTFGGGRSGCCGASQHPQAWTKRRADQHRGVMPPGTSWHSDGQNCLAPPPVVGESLRVQGPWDPTPRPWRGATMPENRARGGLAPRSFVEKMYDDLRSRYPPATVLKLYRNTPRPRATDGRRRLGGAIAELATKPRRWLCVGGAADPFLGRRVRRAPAGGSSTCRTWVILAQSKATGPSRTIPQAVRACAAPRFPRQAGSGVGRAGLGASRGPAQRGRGPPPQAGAAAPGAAPGGRHPM